MFGLVAAILNRVQKYLDVAVSTRQKPRGPVSAPASFATVSTAYVTAYEVSGRGRLVGFGALSTVDPLYLNVRVTVDGFVIPELSGSNTSSVQYPQGTFLTTFATRALDTFANGGRYRNGELEFKSSLKLEVRNTTGGNITLYWYTELE